jgi:vacuolar-type H+-ATPase subunit H
MAPKDEKDPLDRLVGAYENMLERVDELLDKAEETAVPTLKKALEQAREKAIELDELTREEAEKIASYVERDMKDAADFLAENADGFKDWMRFDIQLIEERLLEMFASVADKTRLELAQLADRAWDASFYHTGEITGPGTLICSECGKALHFHKAGHIPPCPGCRGTRYKRHQE